MAYITFFTLVVMLGGMVTFQILFAPLLFTQLGKENFSTFIRAFFPWYYIYFGLLNLILFASFIVQSILGQSDWFLIFLSGFSLLGFYVSRQILMPKANEASDAGEKKAFDRYHRSTVIINTIQLFIVIYLIWP
ncbi:DUF4149 domain-containing protein [Veronia pacifica]|nr:DUF4149 domain-containing protein [Veronia pacifica]